jgi:hypothetical protein
MCEASQLRLSPYTQESSEYLEGVQDGSYLVSSQATKEETDAGEIDQRFACGGQALIVFAHAAGATGPRQCPLHPGLTHEKLFTIG